MPSNEVKHLEISIHRKLRLEDIYPQLSIEFQMNVNQLPAYTASHDLISCWQHFICHAK